MDPTIIDLLTAGSDDDLRSKAQLMSAQLRGDRQLGMMGQIGGKRAAGLGREMLSDADMGERGMLAAGINNQNNNTRQMRAMSEFEKALAVQQARNQGAYDVAQLRALAAGNKERPTKPLPGKEADTLAELNNAVKSISSVASKFQDKYAGQSIAGRGINWLGGMFGSAAPQSVQDQNEFWSAFEMLVNLPVRHEFFGSALTPTEKASWQAAQNITPGKDPEVVRRTFDWMLKTAQEKLDARVGARTKEGVYSGDAIQALTPYAGQSGGAAAPAGTRRFTRVNGKLVEVK